MIIYVCYSSKDYEIAQTLSVELGLLGHDVLFEQKFIGSPVRWHEVFANIASCDLFVFAVSLHSLRSYSCDLEYGYASALNLQILPVLVEAVGNAPRGRQHTMLPYVEWYAQNFSADSIAAVLSRLSPRQSYPAIPPFHPDLTTPLARLRDEVLSLPDSIEAQGFIFDNAVEFLEREDTFANASSILRAMQMHQRISPVIAQEIERTADVLAKSRAQRSSARRRARWIRDIALVLGGALGVLILVRGFLFLRPYLGLEAAQTQEITPEIEPVSGLSSPGTTEALTIEPINSETPTPAPVTTVAPTTIEDRQTQTAIEIENAVATAGVNLQNTATAAMATVFTLMSPTSLPASTVAPSAESATPTPVAAPTTTAVEYTGLQVEDTSVGVRIAAVGQTAALAGIQVDDYVLSVDTTTIHNRVEFLEILSAYPPSTPVTFRLRRGTSDIYIRVTLAPEDFHGLVAPATPVSAG